MKRFLSLILALILCIGLIYVPAAAEDEKFITEDTVYAEADAAENADAEAEAIIEETDVSEDEAFVGGTADDEEASAEEQADADAEAASDEPAAADEDADDAEPSGTEEAAAEDQADTDEDAIAGEPAVTEDDAAETAYPEDEAVFEEQTAAEDEAAEEPAAAEEAAAEDPAETDEKAVIEEPVDTDDEAATSEPAETYFEIIITEADGTPVHTLGGTSGDWDDIIVEAADVENFTGTFHQTEARKGLALVNDFRTGDEAWFWNSDNTTKTQYNVKGSTYLGKLSWDYNLERIAMQRAVEISIYWSHTRPNGTSCFTCEYNGTSSYGENIAYGSGSFMTAEFTMDLWKETDDPYEGQGHRRNMLTPGYQAIGVGCFECYGYYYWVQEFSYFLEGDQKKDAYDSTAQVTVDDDKNVTVDLGPEAPVMSSVKNTGNGVKLTWEAEDSITKYQIQRKASGGEWSDLKSVKNTSYTDGTAQMGTKYAYRVRAYSNGFWSGYSDAKSILFNPFTDVDSSATQTLKYVSWAYNNGIVSGTTSTTFSPDVNCSRIQFVMMLWKMKGSPVVSGKNPFSDISGTKTTNAILWALKEGIINSGKTFNPNDNITRIQVVMILWKMAGSPKSGGKNPFKDVTGTQSVKAVLWAYNNEITKGSSDTTFSPDRNCTRLQLVIFLYKYNNIYNVI